jgi:hypothetical protein
MVVGCGGSAGGGSTPPPPTTYTIGGTISGLTGTGLVLQDNGGNNLSVSASGSFTFSTAVASGAAYSVTVLTQPTGQSCTVTSGSGTASANVSNVQVTCSATTYTIGGTVSGLTGAGLVLQDNGGNNLAVSASGSFTFSTAVASGAAYSVTVLTQPTGQSCTVTNGSGTASANVSNVQVACSNLPPTTYIIGGTVSGLTGAGLVLQDNGGNNLAVSASGSFTFSTAVASGAAYSVTVLTQPTGQSCTVTNGSGTATANVSNVQVTCATTTYTIGGIVSGLTGTGLVLQDNNGNNLAVSASGSFTFSTAVASGSTYSVTVLTQPTGQSCTVTSGSGTASANVTNVQVACSNATIVVSVTPSFATVAPNATQQFTATVQNTTDVAVSWQVNGTTGGSATAGTISVEGLYIAPTAPPATGTVVVTAVSVADPSKSGSASISIFSNANLNGTYNFVFGGIYSLNSGAYTSGSGTFTANGAGQITSGTYTMSEFDFVTPCSGTLSGSYSVSSNGTGSATLTAIASSASAANGCTTPVPLDFTLAVGASGETVGLGLAEDGFQEFNGMTNNSAWGYLYGAGIAMQQGLTSSDANITGEYNYVLAGMLPGMNSYTTYWGDFFPNGAGSIVAGSYDTNNFGSSTLCFGSLSGSYSVNTNGSGVATMAGLGYAADGCSNLTFDFALAATASGNALGLQESANSGKDGLFGAGIAVQQGSPTIATIAGMYNYEFMGIDPSRWAAELQSGSFTANGAGQITGGSYTTNAVGFSTPCTGSLSGSYGVNGTGGATLKGVPSPASAAIGCPNETILFYIYINPSGNTLGLVLEQPSCDTVEDACNMPGFGMGLAVK